MAPEEPTDDALVATINRGGPDAPEAFEALYHRHKQWCARIARRMAPDEHAAMDLVQEAFITLLGEFPGFRIRAGLRAYLYAVVRHRALAAGRRRARDRRPPAPTLPAPPPDADTERLRAALDRLPDAQRETLLMRVVDGMSVSEVAIALGVPAGTVKSRLHKALGALRADPDARAAWGDDENL